MPNSPRKYVDLRKIDYGAMFKGSKGFLVCDFDTRILPPVGGTADMTCLKPQTKEKLLPPVGNFQTEWVKACKGNLKTSCDFEYAENMIETMLLGLVAYWVGKKIDYDGVAGKVINDEAANALLSRKCREGWTLNG